MINIKSLPKEQLREVLTSLGEPLYRYHQVFKWLYQKIKYDFDEFTDLPKGLRSELSMRFYIGRLQEITRKVSKDGTVKFLFQLEDGQRIESVLIPDGKRRTVCVSTQIGCPLTCKFCATGTLRLQRNLQGWEIVEQVIHVQKYLDGISDPRGVTNVVFMGMGEPLLNLNEVLFAIRVLRDVDGPNIGARKITVSTVGIPQGIYRLAESGIQIKLAFSLHCAIQKKREKIVPIAKRYPLDVLREAIDYFYEKNRRWVTLEYIHLPGFNDTEEDIVAISEFIGDLPVKINVIPNNPYPDSPFRAPTEREFNNFVMRLRRRLRWTVAPRKPRGRDIFAACGQLFLESERNLVFSSVPQNRQTRRERVHQ